METLTQDLVFYLVTNGLTTSLPSTCFLWSLCHSIPGFVLYLLILVSVALILCMNAREVFYSVAPYLDQFLTLVDRFVPAIDGSQDEASDGAVSTDDGSGSRIEEGFALVYQDACKPITTERLAEFDVWQSKLWTFGHTRGATNNQGLEAETWYKSIAVENTRAWVRSIVSSTGQLLSPSSIPGGTGNPESADAISSYFPEYKSPFALLTGTLRSMFSAQNRTSSVTKSGVANRSCDIGDSNSPANNAGTIEPLAKEALPIDSIDMEFSTNSDTGACHGQDFESWSSFCSIGPSDTQDGEDIETQLVDMDDNGTEAKLLINGVQAPQDRTSLIASSLALKKVNGIPPMSLANAPFNPGVMTSRRNGMQSRRHSDGEMVGLELPPVPIRLAANMRRRAVDLMEESRGLKGPSCCVTFKQMNPHYDIDTVAGLAKLNLHPLSAGDAIVLTRLHLNYCRKAGVGHTQIVTSGPLHSAAGVPVLRPAIWKELLTHPDVLIADTNPNPGVLEVKFNHSPEYGRC